MAVPALVAALFMLFSAINGGQAATFTMQNKCPYSVWAAALPGGGSEIASGSNWQFSVPAGTAHARIWGRTGCTFDASGHGSCKTGDCGGLLSCQVSGAPPASLAEYTLNGAGNKDFYDISLVDGFNVPISMVPTKAGCPATACTADINSMCPPELKTDGGCKSACVVFGTPQYCCSGSFVDNCPPTNYSKVFKNACSQAYSYAKDDQSSTFTCDAGGDYNIVFCG